ncbi:potassium-transporting ATPase subunit C [Schlesneria paludicola]|uniref:potassium-transporting ATPase subunit C n=1 Tax=Schlesneria paludicola TaxID=360056 RepID=UPI00029B5132|nr:potassium-transporting ATPase subunit C [Schlesneria paludicola]
MFVHLRACSWLLVTTVLLCCVGYPLILLAIGQTVFHSKAEGSLIFDQNGKAIGSRLIAQPFSEDQYFHPRPSAASYNAAASGASNWGSSNSLLRDRVARMLGPIVKYRSGPSKGQLVAADIETWFQQDRFQDKPGIVAEWATTHSTLAVNWVKADPLNAAFVTAWEASHPADLAQWQKDNPDNTNPKPEDLAVAFFTSYSKEHPGTFPAGVTREDSTDKAIQPAAKGADIQSIFFDMWRQEHPDADLEQVPGDLVMASGSGLDPHITLKNALYQLDRVATKWAETTNRELTTVHQEIETLLRQKAQAPLGGLVGVQLINVLEMNLALKDRYVMQPTAGK